MTARSYQVVVYEGPIPPLGTMFAESPAERDFLDLQSNPRRAKEWAQHCADARASWHARTGTPRRRS